MYTLYNVIKILILSTNRLYSKRASRVYFEQRPRAACAWDAISGWDAVSGRTDVSKRYPPSRTYQFLAFPLVEIPRPAWPGLLLVVLDTIDS